MRRVRKTLESIHATAPVWHNPANHHRAVPLTDEQFRYGFANAVNEAEAHELYDTYAVPASGLDVHRDFCEIVIAKEGKVRSAGRVVWA